MKRSGSKQKKNAGETVKKNDIVRLTVTDMTLEGMGVARLDSGCVVFVADAAAGDVCDALILKVRKALAYAKIVRLITPSPDRCSARCEHYRLCGGCSFWHITYEAELELKRRTVWNNLRRLGGVELEYEDVPIIPAPVIDNYRNKVQLPVKRAPDGGALIGFYRRRSHDVIDIRNCVIQPPCAAAASDAVREYMEMSGEMPYDEVLHEGTIRHIFVREGKGTGDVLAAVIANADRLRDEALLVKLLRERVAGLCGVVLNINRERTNVILGADSRVLFGRDELCDEVDGLRFLISHRSFYQVNTSQMERLYSEALSLLSPQKDETVFDLYCGAGTISAFIAKRAAHVVSVEVVEDAVALARRNAELNGLSNCEFFCGDAGEVATELIKRGYHADALVVDPPRKGLDALAIDAITTLSPSRIVYVSCDSATLGRDVKLLSERGYNLASAKAVDMFPRTSHVEVVTLFTRAGAEATD